MPLPLPTIDELKGSGLSHLIDLAETFTEEYIRLIKLDPASVEAIQCKNAIVLIHNVIDEKFDPEED